MVRFRLDLSMIGTAVCFASATCLGTFGHGLSRPFDTYDGQAGLAAFRTPDSQGRSCSGCHAPDGLDLAEGSFDKADLLRRAGRHLDPDNAKTAVAMILDLRQRLGGRRFLNQTMQPGGEVLPGRTAAARDLAFGQELQHLLPALTARGTSGLKPLTDQLLAVDLMNLKVGIAMSPLSQDGFHDPNTGSVNEWLPENGVPSVPALHQLQEAYLANPSWAALAAVITWVKQLPPARSTADSFSRSKFCCLQVLQHMERMDAGLAPRAPMPPGWLESFGINPFWQIGDAARMAARQPLSSIGLDADVLAEKRLGPKDQVSQLELPWMWLGFCFDPSLMHSGPKDDIRRGTYFVQSMLDDGPYPWHILFAIGRKTAEQARLIRQHPSTLYGSGLQLEFDPLVYHTNLDQLAQGTSAQKKAFHLALSREFLWAMGLLTDSIKATGRVSYPESALAQVKAMVPFIRAQGLDPGPSVDALTKAIKHAKRL